MRFRKKKGPRLAGCTKTADLDGAGIQPMGPYYGPVAIFTYPVHTM